MKIMKRILAMILCMALAFAAVPVMDAAAAGSVSVSCGSAAAYAGDTVTVNLSVSGNPGFSAMSIRLDYDKTYLTLQTVTNQVSSLQMSTGLNIVWDSASNYTGNGTLATLTFKIASNAPVGSYTVRVVFNDASNEDFEELSGSGSSGKITVKCTHANKTVVNAKAPTCTATGNNKYYTCSCGAVLKADGVTETTVQKETLAVKAHEYDSNKVTKAPTCKETGVRTYYCKNCDATKTESIPKTDDHTYGKWVKVDDKQHKHTCSVCSKVETGTHKWDAGRQTLAPTCKAEGVKTYTCSDCGGTKTESIPKTDDHVYGAWVKVDDNQHKHTCSVCSKVEKVSHTWDAGKQTLAPTCKAEGVKTFTCDDCDGTKTESIPKTDDHVYGAWVKVDDKQHKHICSVCSKVETGTHKWDAGRQTLAPTCKAEGITTFTCDDCDGTRTESIPKTEDHKYGPWVKVDDKQHKHTCSVCSKEETGSHKWDSGKPTQAPTCKDEGVTTFTCDDCDGTRTEPIPKTEDHKFGSWVKADDKQHKHTCSVCAKEELADHTFDGGKVTLKPTCKDEGIRTFTCTTCGGTKTEPIEKLTTHTYDHGCDTDCNVCGLERTTTHQYKTTWSKDKNQHWHECSVCKDKQDAEDHIPGPEATEERAQTCTTCGYVITPAIGHTHSYGKSWVTDDAGHWHACSGCEEQGSYGAHEFDNACDTDCNVCGFERQTAHDYQWDCDAAGHWQGCTGCGHKIEEAAHTPGPEATATTAQTCTICEYEITPALGVEETEPVETTEPSQPTEPAEETQSEKTEDGSFPWWILIVAAVVLIGGAVLVVFKKKKA